MGERVDVREVMCVSAFARGLAARGVMVNRGTVIRWLGEGKLAGVRVGSRWYVRASELDRVVLFGLEGNAVVGGPGSGVSKGVAGDRWAAAMAEGELVGDEVVRDVRELGAGMVLRRQAEARARLRIGGHAAAEAYCRRMGI